MRFRKATIIKIILYSIIILIMVHCTLTLTQIQILRLFDHLYPTWIVSIFRQIGFYRIYTKILRQNLDFNLYFIQIHYHYHFLLLRLHLILLLPPLQIPYFFGWYFVQILILILLHTFLRNFTHFNAINLCFILILTQILFNYYFKIDFLFKDCINSK